MKDIEKVLFDREALAKAVERIGKEITGDYKDKRPLFLGVLKGAWVFLADLIRAVDIPCDVDFISVSSYGMDSQSSGKVRILKEPDIELKGRDIIIVEDILDTALTLSELIHILSERGPSSIKIAVLLDKNLGYEKKVKADYKCFDVENEFIVGYGIDYAERYRNLPFVGVLKREVYQ